MELPKRFRDVRRKLKVKKSTAGLGLFTMEEIERDGFVIEYVGTILNQKEADKKAGKYLFETNKNRFIDGTNRKNIARYINHSCRPNCEIDILRGRVYVFAKRKILVGEELTYDYEKEYFDEYIRPIGCRCEKCAKK
jgi:uncharacterized protein